MSNVNLKKASTYYLIGNFFNKGISFLTVPVFSRLLSTSDYGIVTTFNSWVSILSMVFGFAIYMGIRAAFIDYENTIDDVLSVTSTFTIISGLLFSGMGVAVVLFAKVNVGLTLVILCCIQGISAALIQNYLMYLTMKYRYKARTAFMIFPNLLSALSSIAIVAWVIKEKLYLGRIVPTTIIYAAFGIFVILLIYKKSHLFYSREYLTYALKISTPLVLHGIALSILSQSDLTMITWLVGSSEAGIYSLIYNFSMIATVITTSLDGVWVPWFTRNLKNDNRAGINAKANDYIMLMTVALICVILIGPEIVEILASNEYWEGIKIIPPIVVANYLVFAYTMYVNIEHFYKRTIYISINTIIAALSNIILNYFLVPIHGYTAAAFTTVASYFMAFILHTLYAKKLEPSLYPLKQFFPPLLQIAGACIIFYLFMDRWFVRWVVLLLYIFIIMVLSKDTILQYVHNRNN